MDSESRLKSLEAVLFDFDGTLANTIPHILASFQHATAEIFGEALPDSVLMHNVGIPLAQQMLELSGRDQEIADRLLVSYRTFNHATHDEMATLYPGAVEVLSAIKARGIPMGIVTSKGTPMANRGINLFDIGGYFDVVVTADDVPLHKPDPYPLVHAASLLGIDVRATAYIGDSPHDVESALRAGAIAIAACWGVSDKERLVAAGAEYLLDDVSEVPGLLFRE
ncbi:MAG: HAD family hydrolase [Actinobacteria bacterium HGW-Actinobacteria-6]|nr:MAG: HAD family hydrolase [Actinobacteria bacterium HGW-Actinobacteria-6]